MKESKFKLGDVLYIGDDYNGLYFTAIVTEIIYTINGVIYEVHSASVDKHSVNQGNIRVYLDSEYSCYEDGEPVYTIAGKIGNIEEREDVE